MGSDIVVEVRGGCLVEVYCADPHQQFILLDWDDLNELPEEQRIGRHFPHDSPDDMPADTRGVYERSIAKEVRAGFCAESSGGPRSA